MAVSVGEQPYCHPAINTSLVWKNTVGLKRSYVGFVSRDFLKMVLNPLNPPTSPPPHSNEVKEDVPGLHVCVPSIEATEGAKQVTCLQLNVCLGGCVVFLPCETTGKTGRLHLKVSRFFGLSP